MRTTRLPSADPEAIPRAAAILRDGGLVAYPTDTLYGLGAHAWQPEALAKVFVAKGRQADRPLPLLIASAEEMVEIARHIPDIAWRLGALFWPGALTLVLPTAARVPAIVTGGGPSVAVRVPDHPVTLALIKALGSPIAGTSANRSGGPAPRSAEEVLAQLDGRIDAVLDGGKCPGGVESSVLDLSGARPRLLREGAIDRATLEYALEGPIES